MKYTQICRLDNSCLYDDVGFCKILKILLGFELKEFREVERVYQRNLQVENIITKNLKDHMLQNILFNNNSKV